MTDPVMWAAATAAGLGGVVVVTTAVLKGWRDWISLQRLAIEGRSRPDDAPAPASPMARIELADLKERVRKLEAIAAGVDL
jgi:hypothetical protein